MAQKLKWSEDGESERDACGSLSELAGTVGLFYIALICMGLVFITLQKLQGPGASFAAAQAPQSALFQAVQPGEGGHR
ncbi:MAG: hypothetical protein ACLPPF_11665 [Rhodomicrobium sp.]